MRAHSRLACLLLFAGFTFAVAGCTSGYKVTGKLVDKGTPIKVSDKGVLQMSFIAEADKDAANPFPVTFVPADSTFKVEPHADQTLPPAGKYRVSIRLVDPYPNGADKFGDKFSPKNTKLVVDVKGNEDLTIDVSKGG